MDWEAYKKGQQDCKSVDGENRGYENNYPEGTESHKSYLRGWNQYWDSEWKRYKEL